VRDAKPPRPSRKKAKQQDARHARRELRRLGPVVGVVEGLVGVPAEHLHAHRAHRARATSTSGWLEELVARCSKDLVAWRKEAFCAVEQALAVFEPTRSQPESVVPPEEL
jgi:hypothetical protein